MNRFILSGSISAFVMASSAAQAFPTAKEQATTFEGKEKIFESYMPSPSAPSVGVGFGGMSAYDSVRINGFRYNPPDTNGAVGSTQYMELINGVFGVYSKAGVKLAEGSDNNFWTQKAGRSGSFGDGRILFDKASSRWVAIGLNDDLSKINVAVSNTSDALGGWNGATFQGFAAGGIADYPTLAIDSKAIYIGTNNFTSSYQGTTLNVLSRAAIFGATGPDVSGKQSFVTPYPPGALADITRGFAIQGVNGAKGNGKAIAADAYSNDIVVYDIHNPGSGSAALGASTYLSNVGGRAFDDVSAARQPSGYDGLPSRVVDALDYRISSAAIEVKGKIYAIHTVTPTGTDHDAVRLVVIDATTKVVLSETDISDPNYDFFQGSLSVNAAGQIVVGYNRSGYAAADGKIRLYARVYKDNGTGVLTQKGGDLLLKESDTDRYVTGVLYGSDPSVARQRWGDYSTVTIDPTNMHSFWVVGEFAREFNRPEDGHPGGRGQGRWGTWISEISVGSVPEPSSWGLMIAGFSIVGAAARRRRQGVVTA